MTKRQKGKQIKKTKRQKWHKCKMTTTRKTMQKEKTQKKYCGKMCGKMYGTIENMLYQNKIWCGTRYGPHDYDSGDKKTKTQKHKMTIR